MATDELQRAREMQFRISDISEVLPDKLYLSGDLAVTEECIHQMQISCIIRAVQEEDTCQFGGVELFHVPVNDAESHAGQLRKYFESVAEKIRIATSAQKRVLVHCRAGVSRSATLVIAYLMRHEGKSLHEAHSFLKERRPFIRPNFGFWKQLIDYEHHLFQKNSVNMIKWRGDTYIPDIYWDEYKDMY